MRVEQLAGVKDDDAWGFIAVFVGTDMLAAEEFFDNTDDRAGCDAAPTTDDAVGQNTEVLAGFANEEEYATRLTEAGGRGGEDCEVW